MQSTSKNMIYNSLLMIFNLMFPLISMSYVSRILGADNLGKVNYAQSIITFLMIFAAAGTELYGIREISQSRDDKKKLNQVFSELMVIKIFSSIIVFFMYILFLVFKYNTTNSFSNLIIFFLTSFTLLFNIFNLDWFFKGIEDYRVITYRSISIKILSFVGMLILVKTVNDVYKYTFLLIIGQGLGYVWSYFYSKKYTNLNFKGLNIRRHYKSLKIFFLSAFVVSIYTTVNGIILGYFSTPDKVAFFNRARQIQGIGTVVTEGITAVLIPRVAYYYKNNREEYKKLLKNSLNYNYILSIPIMLGLIFLSKELNLLLGGEEFLPAARLLVILAPMVVVITIGTWVYYQIMIPMGLEKFSAIMQTCTAIVSIGLNFILIPIFSDLGASIAILSIEIFGPIFSFIILKKVKNISFSILTDSLPKYILASCFMLGIIYLLKLRYSNNNGILVLISIALGSISYFFILFVIKEKVMLDICSFILKKIKGGKE